jgi:hypothetical protein
MTVNYVHEEIYRRFVSEIDSAYHHGETVMPLWSKVCTAIQQEARTGDKLEFLRWASLNDFSVPEEWIPEICYAALRDNPAWPNKWFHLTRETKVGGPKNFSKDFGTSPILIQHAYHLLRYEEATGQSLVDCDVIFEVGGGYGSFCRLLKNAGFNGLHVIYDIPHVSTIQRLYLALSGFDEVTQVAAHQRGRHGFYLVTDVNLDQVVNALGSGALRVGFIATWSLSEFPLAARDRVLEPFLKICRRYMIAFQPQFMGIDNVEYFDAVRRRSPHLNWIKEVLSPSFYLFV